MKITIITLFPRMIGGFFNESIIKRAVDKGLVDIELVDLRQFSTGAYQSVDDKPYGGGAGMVLRADILESAVSKVKRETCLPAGRASNVKRQRIVLTSAKGKVFNQKKAREYSQLEHLIVIAGHYEGVDERVLDYVDEEISIGDFILTGGEIVVSAAVDAIVRLLPGVLKKEEASREESFREVSVNHITSIVGEHEVVKKLLERGVEKVLLLEYPHYTRPEEFKGKKVPPVLLSGNHKEIEKWRIRQAFKETLSKRPDLLFSGNSTKLKNH